MKQALPAVSLGTTVEETLYQMELERLREGAVDSAL